MKKQNKLNCGLAVAGLVLANSAFAVAPPQVENSHLGEGDWILGFSGSYSHVSSGGDELNLFLANVDVSYFVDDSWSVGLSTFGLFVPSGGGVEDSGYALGLEPNLRYYFQSESPYLPYVGVHGGFAYANDGEDSEVIGTYGLHAGLLIPMTENAYFNAQLKWTEFEGADDAEIDLSTVQLLLGFKVKF